VAASRGAGNPYKRDDHDRLGIGMFCETVAGRRRAIRYILLQAELQERLSVKELQLREIHHRLNNQLNFLISYISIHIQTSAVSMIHESVSKSSEEDAPALDEYVSKLGDYILEALVNGGIVIRYDIDKLALPAEKQIIIAPIFSELITNSVKCAFSSGSD
jgi:two-component sensor histidine kinase